MATALMLLDVTAGSAPPLEVLVFTASIHRNVIITAVICLVSWSAARAQQPAAVGAQQPATAEEERRTAGTVEAIGQASIVLRLDQGSFMVFAVDRNTVRPKTPVTKGARVSVVTLTSDTDTAPTALAIDLLPSPQGLAPAASTEQLPPQDAVPPSVRRLETQLERGARKYRAGVQIGAALDPELISVAGFSTLGPFFTRNLQFRPALEFAFGEVTTLFGIHLDGIYTLPGMSRSIRWAPYLGAGPSFAFSHRGFEEETVNGNTVDRFDFGDFSWNNGLNFIVGAKNPAGMFFELKATAYGISKIRLMGGFEF